MNNWIGQIVKHAWMLPCMCCIILLRLSQTRQLTTWANESFHLLLPTNVGGNFLEKYCPSVSSETSERPLETTKQAKRISHFAYLKVPFLKNGPYPASFPLFPSLSHSNKSYSLNLNNISKRKKHRWGTWESNLGPQEGRRNHGAMAAVLTLLIFKYPF